MPYPLNLPFAAREREDKIARLNYMISWAKRAREGSEVREAWEGYLRHAEALRERLLAGEVGEPPRAMKVKPIAEPLSFEDL